MFQRYYSHRRSQSSSSSLTRIPSHVTWEYLMCLFCQIPLLEPSRLIAACGFIRHWLREAHEPTSFAYMTTMFMLALSARWGHFNRKHELRCFLLVKFAFSQLSADFNTLDSCLQLDLACNKSQLCYIWALARSLVVFFLTRTTLFYKRGLSDDNVMHCRRPEALQQAIDRSCLYPC